MKDCFALDLGLVKAIYSYPRRLIGVERRKKGCHRESETEVPAAVLRLSPTLNVPFCLCSEASLHMYMSHCVQHFDTDYKLGALGRSSAFVGDRVYKRGVFACDGLSRLNVVRWESSADDRPCSEVIFPRISPQGISQGEDLI